MSLRIVAVLSLLATGSIAAIGCSSPGSGFSKMNPFHKSEQWEPDDDGDKKSDWRSDAGKIGRGNRREVSEDPLDKLLWSEQARDINRNVGFN